MRTESVRWDAGAPPTGHRTLPPPFPCLPAPHHRGRPLSLVIAETSPPRASNLQTGARIYKVFCSAVPYVASGDCGGSANAYPATLNGRAKALPRGGVRVDMVWQRIVAPPARPVSRDEARRG